MDGEKNKASVGDKLAEITGKPYARQYGLKPLSKALVFVDGYWPKEEKEAAANEWLRDQWERLTNEFQRFGYEALRARMADLEKDIERSMALNRDLAYRREGMAAAGRKVRALVEFYDGEENNGDPKRIAETIQEWDSDPDARKAARDQGWIWKRPDGAENPIEQMGWVAVVAQLEGREEYEGLQFQLSTWVERQTWAGWLNRIRRRVHEELPSRMGNAVRVWQIAELQRDMISDLLYEERAFGVIRRWSEKQEAVWGETLEEVWERQESGQEGEEGSLIRLPYKEPRLRPKTHGNQRWHMFDEFVLNWDAELSVQLDAQKDIASAIDERLHDQFAAEMEQQGMTGSVFDERQLRYARDRHRREREHDSGMR